MGILNFLAAMVVQAVDTVAHVEKEQMDITFVKTHFSAMLDEAKLGRHGLIDHSMFQGLLEELPQAARVLHTVGVDVLSLIDHLEVLFKGNAKGLTFANLLDVVLKLRTKNKASVCDILDLRQAMC